MRQSLLLAYSHRVRFSFATLAGSLRDARSSLRGALGALPLCGTRYASRFALAHARLAPSRFARFFCTVLAASLVSSRFIFDSLIFLAIVDPWF